MLSCAKEKEELIWPNKFCMLLKSHPPSSHEGIYLDVVQPQAQNMVWVAGVSSQAVLNYSFTFLSFPLPPVQSIPHSCRWICPWKKITLSPFFSFIHVHSSIDSTIKNATLLCPPWLLTPVRWFETPLVKAKNFSQTNFYPSLAASVWLNIQKPEC